MERLSRYLSATGRDIPRALELYEYNVQLSEVLYGILHGLEITVRNAAHYALTASYGTSSWYDGAFLPAPTVPLSPYWRDQLTNAKAKAVIPRAPGIAPRPGKVVAELTFGFWVDLLKKQNHWPLWVNRKLHSAFPNARRQRGQIHDRLKAIQLLRNRISHHEPVLTAANALYTGDGVITLAEVLECIEWVCADTARWIEAEFHYAEAERILRTVAALNISL
jgi:hypothetical protein